MAGLDNARFAIEVPAVVWGRSGRMLGGKKQGLVV